MDELDNGVESRGSEVGPMEVEQVHPLDWDCPEKLKALLEGAIFASLEPVAPKALQQLFPETARPSFGEIQSLLSELQADYTNRAVELFESPLGFRFQVRPAATALVKTMMTEKPPRYSRASLETLALIAYRQPITRGEIEEVRGVSVSTHILRTMEERGWVRIVGHKEVPGRPALWATTPTFLAYFGLDSLEELPPLTEIQLTNTQDSVALKAPPSEEHATIPETGVKIASGFEVMKTDETVIKPQDDAPSVPEDEDMTLAALASQLRKNVLSDQEAPIQGEVKGALERLKREGKESEQ